MNWYYPDGNTTVPAGPRGSSPNAMNGNAVMYDAVAGKILTLGGAPNYGVRSFSAQSRYHVTMAVFLPVLESVSWS